MATIKRWFRASEGMQGVVNGEVREGGSGGGNERDVLSTRPLYIKTSILRNSLLSLLFLTCLSYGEGQESHIPQTPSLSAAGFSLRSASMFSLLPQLLAIYRHLQIQSSCAYLCQHWGGFVALHWTVYATGINILHREERKTANLKCNADQWQCTYFIQVKKNTLVHNPNGCIKIIYHSSYVCVNKDKKCKLDMREHNISEESFTEKHIKCDCKLTAQIK